MKFVRLCTARSRMLKPCCLSSLLTFKTLHISHNADKAFCDWKTFLNEYCVRCVAWKFLPATFLSDLIYRIQLRKIIMRMWCSTCRFYATHRLWVHEIETFREAFANYQNYNMGGGGITVICETAKIQSWDVFICTRQAIATLGNSGWWSSWA